MRALVRNQTEGYYANVISVADNLDSFDIPTFGKKIGYSTPVKFKANISSDTGELNFTPIGLLLDTDKVVLDARKKLDIRKDTVFWLDGEVTSNPHNYRTHQIVNSLNYRVIVVRRVNISAD